MSGQIRIFLIDDHQMFLDGIIELVKSNSALELFGYANSAENALTKIKGGKVDLLITDVNLPEMKGPELIRHLKASNPEIKIIALSMHHEKHIVDDVLKAGADSYVLKSSSHAELLDAIERTTNGEVFVSAQITRMLVDAVKYPSILDQLSDREKEIIRLIASECTNKQIAEQLFISEKTVETHKRNIFRKTSTNSAVGLTRFAMENQLV